MGPLTGIRILEFAGIGPGPFTAMMLSDMGAEILRIDRAGAVTGASGEPHWDLMQRGRRSAALDLKHPDAVATALRLIERADALIEGFRPGVMERLGLGPDMCLARNPRLVYGRMTGWGQEGPMAHAAGHDINYIALAGSLAPIGRKGAKPTPPLNLVGDFGGGGMLLAFGVACALIEAHRSGRGQVVDAAMVEGASLLTAMFWGLRAGGQWSDTRGENVLDTGAPWYDVYETRDGKYVAIGAIEPKFYAELLARTGLANEALPAQDDRARWPDLRRRFEQIFAGKTRDEWCAIFEGSDACFSPVLTFDEAKGHPHNIARRGHVAVGTVDQPAPAPHFSRTPGVTRRAPPERGARGAEALADWGFSAPEIERLRAQGVGFAS